MNFRFIIVQLLLFICISMSSGQTVIWSDNFNNGCASNCLASAYGGWSILDNIGGTTGGAPNNWYVSCADEGVTPPGCGSSCVGDATLHIGYNPGGGGDMGATYNETGVTNATFRLAASPVISTVGYTATILKFDFTAFGSAACSEDRAQLWLSADGGATWPVGYQYCLTSVCCGACNGYSQGQWTAYSLTLPASFNNNPNVKVGFHWRNNGNGSGTDPSVSIDDVQIIQNIAAPLNLVDFSASNNGAIGTLVQWKSVLEQNFNHYEVQRSLDGFTFKNIATLKGKCNNSAVPCYYTYEDLLVKEKVYYRLKMVDLDGSFSYSSIISTTNSKVNEVTLLSTIVVEDQLKINVTSFVNNKVNFSIYDLNGKWILTKMNEELKSGTNLSQIDVSTLSEGVYILKIYSQNDAKSISAKFLKSKY